MEKLTVKNLGPIKDFTMETNRLTVLIGPQASGKSLLMQMLYFANDIKSLAAENHFDNMGDDEWINMMLTGMLSQIRGAAITGFAHRDGSFVQYVDNEGTEINAAITDVVRVDDRSRSVLLGWRNEWRADKSSLSSSQFSNNIYIPSERLAFSVFRERKESILYDPVQTPQMRRFCSRIENGKSVYMHTSGLGVDPAGIDLDKYTELQKSALGGIVRYVGGLWSWHVNGAGYVGLGGLSSGQMAAWPFFLLASVFGSWKIAHNFYFEEPEIHLHPSAQVKIVQSVAYLVASGHNVVITTHSPFILYVINNLIQAHIAYDGNPPEGEFSINPDHVAAYCLGDKPRSIVKPDTKLLELREIDSVFDKLNVDFERYMDMEFAREGK